MLHSFFPPPSPLPLFLIAQISCDLRMICLWPRHVSVRSYLIERRTVSDLNKHSGRDLPSNVTALHTNCKPPVWSEHAPASLTARRGAAQESANESEICRLPDSLACSRLAETCSAQNFSTFLMIIFICWESHAAGKQTGRQADRQTGKQAG